MRFCQQCRRPLPTNAPEGLCPACLAKVALGSEPAKPGATMNINPLAEAAPPPGAGWEVEIGCEQASSTVKRGFGTAKWLANLGAGKRITETARNSSFTP
jgi:hypothetical protein